MKTQILTGLLAACLSAGVGATAGIELPRRGTLGLRLAPLADGMVIAAVGQGTDAWRAGVRQGDRLLAINSIEIRDYSDVQAATHQLSYREPAAVRISRNGGILDLRVTPRIMPYAQVEGADVEYGFVVTPSGLRIRTVTLTPRQSDLERDGRLPGVVYLQGIPCQSIDMIGGPDHPRGRLFHALIDAGFAVTFADKPGIGDSDGEACRDGGFDIEVEAYTAATAAFARRRGIDSGRIYAVGVSLGGAQAPLVAQDAPLAGIVTWGAGVQPWFDYLISNFRLREWESPTASADVADRHFDAFREVLARAILLEHSPARIRDDAPEALAAFENAYGSLDAFSGRSLTFHREMNSAPVRAAWERYDGRLLSLHGEFDTVATGEDHAWAAQIVNRNSPGAARFEVLDGVDHGWRRPDSQAPDFSFHARAADWLTMLAAGGS